MRIIEDKDIPLAERKVALEALGGIDDPEVIDRLKAFFNDQDLGNAAAYALRRTLDKSRAGQLVDLFAQAPDPTRRGIISALASRVETLEVLLDAIENNKIAKESVDASSWRQFASANNWQLLERARKHTKVLDIPGNRKELIEKEEELLSPDLIAKANVNSGRAIWIAKCGNCHKLYGEGGQIGPELTGAQRSNLRYWLENILAPSAIVAENYRSTAFRTIDGRVITGVVLSETANDVTIQTAQEKIVLNTIEIEERNPSQSSLMPEGLLEGLSEDAKLNLFKYLMSTPQELSKQR
ncbi:MAG: c-type cytochrome [Planctomycetaceae bacterium]|nr:c-type cytochrome [Planctomycetaceae bacterium]